MKIFVLIEEHMGEARKASLQALGLAARVAAQFGTGGGGADGGAHAIVLGGGATAVAKTLGAYGAAAATVVDDDSLESYIAEHWVAATAAAIGETRPFLLLMGASNIGRDIGPRLAQRLGAGYLADVTGIEKGDGAAPRWIRPVFAGKATEHVEMLTASSIVSIRPNAFPLPAAASGAGEPAITPLAKPDVSKVGVKVRAIKRREGLDKVELTEAEIIVSGGIGVGGPEGYAPLKELCGVLGAALGASRAAVHAGWIDADHQVGQTGKTVSPQLYVACGISGAIQHQAGMRTSKCIVAINTDPEAPIFKIAHYGIVGDVHKVVPSITAECRKVLGR